MALPKPRMTAREKVWQAEDDARTLRAYSALAKDEKRLKAASEVLEKEAQATQAALSINYTNQIFGRTNNNTN